MPWRGTWQRSVWQFLGCRSSFVLFLFLPPSAQPRALLGSRSEVADIGCLEGAVGRDLGNLCLLLPSLELSSGCCLLPSDSVFCRLLRAAGCWPGAELESLAYGCGLLVGLMDPQQQHLIFQPLLSSDQPSSTGEQKTKPTQNSVRELRGLGLSPDLVRFAACLGLAPGSALQQHPALSPGRGQSCCAARLRAVELGLSPALACRGMVPECCCCASQPCLCCCSDRLQVLHAPGHLGEGEDLHVLPRGARAGTHWGWGSCELSSASLAAFS